MLAASTIRHGTLLISAVALVVSSHACSSPTAPICKDKYGRGDTSFNRLNVSCATIGSDLQCDAVAIITGLYVYCPMQEDVTQSAVWTTGDSNVVRSVAPGVFEAVGPGHTFVNAAWRNLPSSVRPVSVFAGSPPLPTYEIAGGVYLQGRVRATGAIDGAVIQILDGLVAGRTAIRWQFQP